MRLQHLHLPGLTRYTTASTLQDLLVRAKVAYHHPQPQPSDPTPLALLSTRSPLLLTFTSQPTYTTGRRDYLSPEQISKLTQPPHTNNSSSSPQDAAYISTSRGGLATFHGPGQLVAYPILHLRSHNLGPRTYIRLLERSIISTLAAFGVKGYTRCDYPGVWVSDGQKLASIGVHVQRGVTCFGTGINVSTDPTWWERIIACGIEGVDMVGLRDMGVKGLHGQDGVQKVGQVLAEELAKGLSGVTEASSVLEWEVEKLKELAWQRDSEHREHIATSL